MPAYTTRTAILTLISSGNLTNFLDDDRDGTEDAGALDNAIAAVSMDIDGRLSSIYDVPFDEPVPAPVQAAALILLAESLYAKRLTPDEYNPFRAQANAWRIKLDFIGTTGTGLDARFQRSFAPGSNVAMVLPVICNSASS